ncbi:hypothetical protein HMPREF1869_01437 [Bacteroidales bacterium KA00251]|nr:hypothetical protein HMPREF1869_01437 [Bacteroidales bacterium KA00251]
MPIIPKRVTSLRRELVTQSVVSLKKEVLYHSTQSSITASTTIQKR